MKRRSRVHVEVTETTSKRGHQIVDYRGPVRYATLFIAPERVIVRRGTIDSGDIPVEASIYDKDQLDTAHGSARRYARRRT